MSKTVFQATSGKVSRSARNGKMTKMTKNLTSDLKDELRVFLPSPVKTGMVGQNLWSLHISPPLPWLLTFLSQVHFFSTEACPSICWWLSSEQLFLCSVTWPREPSSNHKKHSSIKTTPFRTHPQNHELNKQKLF